MGIIDDPISGVLGAFFKRALDSKIMQRATLVLEMGIAGTLAYFLADGSQLMLGKPELFARGCGLVAAGLCMLGTFQASPNSKGLTISLQKDFTQEENQTPMEAIKK
jgi:hypothetical protein